MRKRLVPVVRLTFPEATHARASGLGGGWQRLLLPRARELRTSGVLPGRDALSLAIVTCEGGGTRNKIRMIKGTEAASGPSWESGTGAVADLAWNLLRKRADRRPLPGWRSQEQYGPQAQCLGITEGSFGCLRSAPEPHSGGLESKMPEKRGPFAT